VRLLVIGIAVLVGLVVGEVGLRLAGLRFDGSISTSDPQLGWSLRPGASAWNVSEGEAFVQVNRHGQRDVEWTIEKSPGKYRIAVLGDSMVAAAQVPLEQRFTEVMSRELAGCTQRPVEVLNFGVGGYSTAQELLQLRSRVWAFQPDLVVLSVYFGNDLYDNTRALDYTAPARRPFFVLKDGNLILDETFKGNASASHTRTRMRNWAADMMNHSRLLLMINSARVAMRQARGAAGPATGGRPLEYFQRGVFKPPSDTDLVEAWLTTEAILLQARNEVKERGAAFSILYLPTGHETEPDARKRQDFLTGVGPGGDLSYARNRLIGFAKEAGIRVFDPTQPLLDYAVTTQTYVNGFKNTRPNDGHFNEHGHRIVGQVSAQAICGAQLNGKGSGQ
jgi:hypothetical protein